jgi:preprotein translocase subunit YajC
MTRSYLKRPVRSATAMHELTASAIFAASEGEANTGGSLLSAALLPLMLVAGYFLIIRPNSRRRKEAIAEQAALQSALAIGDEVITTSGIVGKITGEDGPTRFWLEIDDDVQIRIARPFIQARVSVDDEAADTGDAAGTPKALAESNKAESNKAESNKVDTPADPATDAADRD